MDFVLRRCCKVEKLSHFRKLHATNAVILAVVDVYTDLSTCYNLFGKSNGDLCSYSCTSVMSSFILIIILFSIILQVRQLWQNNYKNIVSLFLGCLGLGTIPILFDIWNKITDDEQYNKLLKIRWIETTNEALPAAAIQIVVVLFFSNLDGSNENSLGISQTIIIGFSIVVSLFSVGNGCRKYIQFKGSKINKLKSKLYYYSVAIYTATDMFNRSLIIALFWTVIVDSNSYDYYVPSVILSVIIHQYLVNHIQRQRSSNGIDDGSIGTNVMKHWYTKGLFIFGYLLLPSGVVFIRNFHVSNATLSVLVIKINGIVFFILSIIFVILWSLNGIPSLIIFQLIGYVLFLNLIPFIIIWIHRTKVTDINNTISNTSKQIELNNIESNSTINSHINSNDIHSNTNNIPVIPQTIDEKKTTSKTNKKSKKNIKKNNKGRFKHNKHKNGSDLSLIKKNKRKDGSDLSIIKKNVSQKSPRN